jgi:hypothetical protein
VRHHAVAVAQVELTWRENTDPGEWWGPAEEVLSLAHQRTPLPGSGIAPQDYTADAPRDIAAFERTAGRDPLSHLKAWDISR